MTYIRKMITRIAPSPTGYLHVGNARTALVNWLFARKHGGQFILRIDDTDLERSKPEFERAIMEDLSWLGLNWDRLEHQSARFDRYEEVKRLLLAEGRLYACYETAEDLDIKRKILLKQGKPPIYDRASLRLTQAEIAEHEARGVRPHFRFKLEHKPIGWDDMVQGQLQLDAGSISDPVVIRADRTWTYMLCSAVDDIDFNVSHIIRGDDHISNTVTHIQMFESLGARPPIFGHLARIVSKDQKISKRVGGFDLRTMREEKHLEPMAVNSFLALTGTSKNVEAIDRLEDLVEAFDIKDFHKSPTNYEEADIVRLNHTVLSHYALDQVRPRLEQFGALAEPSHTGSEAAFWDVVRKNLNTLPEAKLWHDICFESIDPVVNSDSDREFLLLAAKFLPDDLAAAPWTEQTWSEWLAALKPNTSRKGAGLFMPLRLALTGVSHGPELKSLLPLIGRERAVKRLTGGGSV